VTVEHDVNVSHGTRVVFDTRLSNQIAGSNKIPYWGSARITTVVN